MRCAEATALVLSRWLKDLRQYQIIQSWHPNSRVSAEIVSLYSDIMTHNFFVLEWEVVFQAKQSIVQINFRSFTKVGHKWKLMVIGDGNLFENYAIWQTGEMPNDKIQLSFYKQNSCWQNCTDKLQTEWKVSGINFPVSNSSNWNLIP